MFCIIGIQEGKRRGEQKTTGREITENLPDLWIEASTQAQET